MLELRNFQKRFIKAATATGVDTACLSLPRGNGKSALAGHLVTRILTPSDPLFRAGTESVLCARNIEQARIVFRFARADLEPLGGYRFLDSHTRIGITHLGTNTRLRIISSNGKSAMGLVQCPWAICDEPGSWEVIGGQLMHDAIQTAMGKPGSPLTAIYIGTLAPALSGWWHDLIQGGSRGSTYVQSLQGNRESWDNWNTIRKANPLTAISPELRGKLKEEREAAWADSRLKARFLSYRLNLPTSDESEMLLTTDDWERMAARETPERKGRPIVAVDLGGGRSWSAAVAAWQGGRIEALAVAPGVPALEEQERRDRVASGTYQRLAEMGLLAVAPGLRVQPPGALWEAIRERWGVPVNMICDRFRLPELMDAVGGSTPIEPRVARWSEAAFDIRSLRALAKDGPMVVSEESRPLVAASLSVALVKSDDQGSTRLVKKGTNNTARDDVAAALTLVAGAYMRAERKPPGVTHVVV